MFETIKILLWRKLKSTEIRTMALCMWEVVEKFAEAVIFVQSFRPGLSCSTIAARLFLAGDQRSSTRPVVG
jgi:hypothetical protein